jgi:hypothetical protein
MRKLSHLLFALFSFALPFVALGDSASPNLTNGLSWRVKQDKVDADIQQWDLAMLLKRIASATGWKVYVEPGTSEVISAKFKSLP